MLTVYTRSMFTVKKAYELIPGDTVTVFSEFRVLKVIRMRKSVLVTFEYVSHDGEVRHSFDKTLKNDTEWRVTR